MCGPNRMSGLIFANVKLKRLTHFSSHFNDTDFGLDIESHGANAPINSLQSEVCLITNVYVHPSTISVSSNMSFVLNRPKMTFVDTNLDILATFDPCIVYCYARFRIQIPDCQLCVLPAYFLAYEKRIKVHSQYHPISRP